MAATSRSSFVTSKTETDVAVLQIQVTNIESKIADIKEDIKNVHEANERNTKFTQELLKEMRDASSKAHAEINKKIDSFEKWRWMLMGAGIVLGSLGFDAISKLLK